MASRAVSCKTFILFLLLLCVAVCVICAPAKNSGNRQRNKGKSKGAGKITLNPNNPFFTDQRPPEIRYHDNPFLGSSNGTQKSQENPADREIPSGTVYHSNPFLSSQNAPNLTNKSETLTEDAVRIENSQTTPSVLQIEPIRDQFSSNEPARDVSKAISELKCDEYSNDLKVRGLSLVGSDPGIIEGDNEECRTPLRLVVGGETAAPGEFPHMVGLGRRSAKGNFSFYCGGSLISPNWVLTAAHCTYGPNGSPNAVRLGFHSLEDDTGSVETIKRIVRHPTYKPPAMYADIALVKLANKISFNKTIRPACLYQKYDSVPARAWVTGWGVSEFGGELRSELQKADLELIDNVACSIRHNGSVSVPYGVTPSMVCAGDPGNNWKKDTCQGDSGGPLQAPHPKNPCLVQIIGITSFGDGCAVLDSPGVYTRVSHFLDWIEDIVWPN